MPDIHFHHPNIPNTPNLIIPTGMDDISWAYNLNTMVYPTYGGEVIQILSCFVDDLVITGTLSGYVMMERVYEYFAGYLQIATQGTAVNPQPGQSSYNQVPLTMTYPERGWTFKLQLMEAPGFSYGRDVVAPAWRIRAHIVDDTHAVQELVDFTKSTTLEQFLKSDRDSFDIEGRIGFKAENPFSAAGTIFGDEFDPEYTREKWQQTNDRFNEVVNAYLDSDLTALYETLSSRPRVTQDTAGEEKDDERADRGRERADGKINP